MECRYSDNQLRRFASVYLRDYNEQQAAFAAGIKLDDASDLLLTDRVVQLIQFPEQPKGRLAQFDPLDHMDAIVEWVGEGKTLADYCRQPDTPKFNTIYDWMAKDKEFDKRFTRAREDGYDVIAQDCLRIADTQVNEVISKEHDKHGTEITKKDAIQHRKLQVETRLKLLAKWNPKKYGEFHRNEHTGAGGGPIKTESTESLDSKDVARRIALILKKGVTQNEPT